MSQPKQRRHPVLAAFVVTIALGGFSWSALADRGLTDRSVAEQTLTQVAGSASPAASHAMARARESLARADNARRAGDERNAKLLEALAREWAEMAADVSRATKAERRADERQRAAASAAASVRKVEALLEALVAHRSRAQGELQQLHSAAGSPFPSAALSAAMIRPAPPVTSAAPKGSGR